MSNRLYARMVVPSDVREYFEKGELLKSLETNDLKVAEYKAAQLFHEWRTQIEKYRGSSTALDEALRWKKIIEKERLKDADLLAAFRRENPDRDLMASDVENLGMGHNSLVVDTYLERVAKTEGPAQADLLADIIHGNKLPTLAFLDEWTKSLEGKVIPRTMKQHDTRIKTLAQKFPALPIKKTEVARWIMELEGDNKAEATIKGLIGGCRTYYDYLMRMGHIDPDSVNPFLNQKFTKKRRASRTDKRQAWTSSDIVKLSVEASKATNLKARNVHHAILIAAFTGMRIEEIADLKVESVIEDEGIMALQINEAKTDAGIREIPIHKDLLPIIEHLIKESTDGYLLPEEPITTNGERSSALGKRFGRLKTKLGYDHLYVFHSIRKTVSTLLERQGLHANQAAQILGHEKVGETYGTYSGGLTIKDTLEFINKISYPGLKLPKD